MLYIIIINISCYAFKAWVRLMTQFSLNIVPCDTEYGHGTETLQYNEESNKLWVVHYLIINTLNTVWAVEANCQK